MSNKLLAQWSYGRFSDEDRLDGLVTAGTLLPFTLPLIFLPGRNITVYIKTTTVPTCCEILLQLLTSDTQNRSTTADFQTVFTTSTKTDRNLGPKAALPPLRGAHSSPSMFL